MADIDHPETFIWCGQMRYRCPLSWAGGAACNYDTYSLESLHEHIRSTHADMLPQIRREVSPLVDADGKPIVREVVREAPVPEEFRKLNFRKE